MNIMTCRAEISKEEARSYLVNYQNLNRAGRFEAKEGILKCFERIKSIQYDPLDIVGRNPDLVLQVKGVTLERDGVAAFPDAPTERGIKHIRHLIRALREGYEAYLVFVIQFKPVKYFVPNDSTHPAFGQVLREAAEAGVGVLAYDCKVTADTMLLDHSIRVKLSESY